MALAGSRTWPGPAAAPWWTPVNRAPGDRRGATAWTPMTSWSGSVDLGILSAVAYTTVVLMALATTLMAAPALRRVLGAPLSVTA
jgi:hypothetical protein